MSSKALGGLCLYGVIMTASTAVLAYLLTTSCGIDSKIEGSDNEVDNKIQKGLVNVDFLLRVKDLVKRGRDLVSASSSGFASQS